VIAEMDVIDRCIQSELSQDMPAAGTPLRILSEFFRILGLLQRMRHTFDDHVYVVGREAVDPLHQVSDGSTPGIGPSRVPCFTRAQEQSSGETTVKKRSNEATSSSPIVACRSWSY
jgi:hypothetical protein